MASVQADIHQNDLFRLSRRRVITRRGVLWLGQTCNLRCHFCYFLDRINDKEHPEHAFMSVEKAKRICSTLVDHYGNNAIDIQGGEPTIYPHIGELTHHCREIGLLPTLITNAIPLSNPRNCTELQQAGIRDLLVSVQGLDETYDRIVGVPNAFPRQMRGLENIAAAAIPMRFNCVLSKPVLPQLQGIAQMAIRYNVRAVNFIAFNPFEDQQQPGKRSAFNVPRYSEVGKHLDVAIDLLSAAGIECNVRYFPLCMVAARHRKSVFDFQQLPYDTHEWDYASWAWTAMPSQRRREGDLTPPPSLALSTYDPQRLPPPIRKMAGRARDLIRSHPTLASSARKVQHIFGQVTSLGTSPIASGTEQRQLYEANGRMRAGADARYRYSPDCARCAARRICDGFHGDYAALFGVEEARPITDEPPIIDPQHYIRHQDKVVEAEDFSWAL